MTAHQAGCCCDEKFNCPCCLEAPDTVLLNFGVGPFWTSNPLTTECDACETIQGEFELPRDFFSERSCRWRFFDPQFCLDSNVLNRPDCLFGAEEFFRLTIDVLLSVPFSPFPPFRPCRLTAGINIFGGLGQGGDDADDCLRSARVGYRLSASLVDFNCLSDSPFVLSKISESTDNDDVCILGAGMPQTITVDFAP